MTDHVNTILAQWAQERPDLDVRPMAIVGRVKKLSRFYETEMEKTFAHFGLNYASFDVLATLLRSGKPYSLTPNELIASTMVTSGTMTNRIDHLEKADLVSRRRSEKDKRSFTISLTEKGYDLISRAIEAHVETLHRVTATLTESDHDAANEVLLKALTEFERSQA